MPAAASMSTRRPRSAAVTPPAFSLKQTSAFEPAGVVGTLFAASAAAPPVALATTFERTSGSMSEPNAAGAPAVPVPASAIGVRDRAAHRRGSLVRAGAAGYVDGAAHRGGGVII